MSDMVKKVKNLRRHKSEDQEREFWSKSDSTDYIDWSEARPLGLPNLKPSLNTISLRLPEHMLAELKVLANKRDVPYQSLLKLFLAERLDTARTIASGLMRAWMRNAPDRMREAHEGEVVLVVRNSGSGIKPEDLPHVFERFRKADENLQRGIASARLLSVTPS